ncbi:MAG TPA: MASE1 domain-containing protein [Polyangiaceae bacterium]|nr:MASE1 domain-containing protein [Polyangiaceae bacterium]
MRTVSLRISSRAVADSVVLAVVYALVAKMGLALDAVGGFATLVWPATGIALAAVLLRGYGVWPGVALGAFAANLWTGAPVAVAVGIAVGNTAEAVLGAWALRRVARFRPSLERVRDVLALISLAAVASTCVSATLGVASLRLGGVVEQAALGETWRAWWVGDLVGDLVFAPILLVFLSPSETGPEAPSVDRSRRGIELTALAAVFVGSSALVFWWDRPDRPAFFAHAYAIFPFLIWAALRFGPRGAAVAGVAVSGAAVVGAVGGRGPFTGARLSDALLQVQAFMVVAVSTTLILGSIAAERRRALGLRDSIVSLAAHELRTPLTSLLLRSQMVGRAARAGATGTDALVRDAEAVERLVRRLGRLVDDLLDVSRLAAGQLRLSVESVDLAALAREVVDRLQERERALVSIASRGEPIVGRWDRLRVDQILTNLVSNAIKYGDDKPVEVMIEQAGARARIVVRDRGGGIAEADLARIFGRFERATSKSVGGFGLGLWIVQHVTAALGGTITVDSRVGAGSTFVVELPLGSSVRAD